MNLFNFFIYLYFCKSIFSFSHSPNRHAKKLSLNLPHVTEVFPEINYFMNIFKIKKGVCKNDDDCLTPLKCCDNPLDKYNKMCCSGNGQKIPVQENMFIYT
jgi:hypothetical protein